MIKGVRLPIRWPELGFEASFALGGVALADGSAAWAWQAAVPALGIDTFPAPSAVSAMEGWGVDHVVLLVPDVDLAVLEIEDAGYRLRERAAVRGHAAASFDVQPVLEVVETEVPAPQLYGLALWTTGVLGSIANLWRAAGFEVAGPGPAAQSDREMIVVKGLEAGLAVMSPEG